MQEPELQVELDPRAQEIILAASQHDIPLLRRLLREYTFKEVEPADVQDPDTGYTPLHAAIAACERDDATSDRADNGCEAVNGELTNGVGADEDHPEEGEEIQAARETVKFLLHQGAIWNQLDVNDETPGCIARRIGLREVYELMVDAGVRAEMLLNRLDQYEKLSDDSDEAEVDNPDELSTQADPAAPTVEQPEAQGASADTAATLTTDSADAAVTSNRYLQSNLTLSDSRILDADQNGVMMAWEHDIMHLSATKLISSSDHSSSLTSSGSRILNIGHGMGIIDSKFQTFHPSLHHIVEAHPAVLADMRSKGWHEKPGVTVHEGRWQDVLPRLVEQGLIFDAIYYDTFAESYADFRDFFSEQVIGLLEPNGGRWSFFHGMGADRQISYDVYQRVTEMDLFEAGFDVEWEEVDVPKLEGEWQGVRRPYWVVDKYRLPVCRFMD